MFNNIFDNSSYEDKIKSYEEFNDPNNIFQQGDLSKFLDTGTDEIEATVNKQNEDAEMSKLSSAQDKNEDLLGKIQSQMQPTNYTPIVTDNNPFPYLRKPILDLSKYDTDETAQKVIKQIDSSEYDQSDKKYLKLLGARESDFRLNAGKGSYKGIFQFNTDALKAVGISMDDYLGSANKQFEAALKYRDNNLRELKDYQKYIGTVKDGILVTKNGLGAMAHLLGPGTVKDYFDGTKKTKLAQNGFKDGDGTPISDYLKLFA